MLLKILYIPVLFTLVSVGAYAQIEVSAGGGVFFNSNFGNGVEAKLTAFNYLEEINFTTYGIYVFFDAAYLEANAAAGFGSIDYEFWNSDGSSAKSKTINITILDITLLGKYPFNLGSIIVFPLAGIGYTMVLSMENETHPGDFNQIGLLFGGGLDINLTEKLYLRTTALFQIRFASKSQDDQVSIMKSDLGASDTNTALGMGPVIKVGIGYRF